MRSGHVLESVVSNCLQTVNCTDVKFTSPSYVYIFHPVSGSSLTEFPGPRILPETPIVDYEGEKIDVVRTSPDNEILVRL